MAVQIQVRRGLAADWISINPTLAEGEIGNELDTGKWKTGDGVTAWVSLAYSVGADGTSGTSGTSGVNGTSGTSGAAGGTGTSGTSGTSGVDGGGGSAVEINPQTDSYTLVLTDAGKLITAAKSTALTITVPSSSTVDFPTGSVIDIVQTGVGKASFTTASINVILSSQDSKLSIGAQYVGVSLIKSASDGWLLLGNLIT